MSTNGELEKLVEGEADFVGACVSGLLHDNYTLLLVLRVSKRIWVYGHQVKQSLVQRLLGCECVCWSSETKRSICIHRWVEGNANGGGERDGSKSRSFSVNSTTHSWRNIVLVV